MMLVEVNSVTPKRCRLLVNLEHLVEVAPLVNGGCVLFFNCIEAGVAKTITVSDEYSTFKQFALETVTPESIQKRFPTKRNMNTIKPQEEGKGVQFSDHQYGESESK